MWQQILSSKSILRPKSVDLYKRAVNIRRYSIYDLIEERYKKKPGESKTKFPLKYKTVHLKFGTEARRCLLNGVSRIGKSAVTTLGPGGRNVTLDYENGDPKITKDGVTVVKSVFEKNRADDLGAKLIKRIAGNTNLFAGDGTTTSTLIAKSLLERGFFMVEQGGFHPIGMKRGMDKALKIVFEYLKQMSIPVSTESEIFNICQVSSNSEETVSRVVAQTMASVGLDGVVNIVESPTGETKFALVNGLVIERGFVSDAFVVDNKVEQKCELEQPLVLTVANKIKEQKDIVRIMEMVKKAKQPLLVFSEDMQDEPLGTMVYNNSKGNVQCCAVNVPWMANIQKEFLKDISVLTGSTLIDNEYDIKLSEVEYKHFGTAKKIVVDSAQTHIVGGIGKELQLQTRLSEILEQIASEPSHNLKKVHRERYARMQAKIAEIQVGGRTEAMRGEIRDMIVDALNSAKSAMSSGMLPGGGLALYQASKVLKDSYYNYVEDENEGMGVQILGQVLKEPIKNIIQNKTYLSSAKILEKIDQQDSLYYGYDVRKERYCDMIDEGIVDSYNVVKVILQDSVAMAGLILTTECLVVKDKSYEPLPLSHYQERREFF